MQINIELNGHRYDISLDLEGSQYPEHAITSSIYNAMLIFHKEQAVESQYLNKLERGLHQVAWRFPGAQGLVREILKEAKNRTKKCPLPEKESNK